LGRSSKTTSQFLVEVFMEGEILRGTAQVGQGGRMNKMEKDER
jgi:hypothetical protein